MRERVEYLQVAQEGYVRNGLRQRVVEALIIRFEPNEHPRTKTS